MFKKILKFIKKCLFIKEKSKPDLTIICSKKLWDWSVEKTK